MHSNQGPTVLTPLYCLSERESYRAVADKSLSLSVSFSPSLSLSRSLSLSLSHSLSDMPKLLILYTMNRRVLTDPGPPVSIRCLPQMAHISCAAQRPSLTYEVSLLSSFPNFLNVHSACAILYLLQCMYCSL